jgi:hypothetical protein
MKNIFVCQNWDFGYFGFTNQIFKMVSSIIIAHKTNKKVIILPDIFDTTNRMLHSNIFNVQKINEHLKKYDILSINRHCQNFRIDKVVYGFENDLVDLTNEIKNRFYQNNVLRIPKEINLNHLQGDPIKNKSKQLTIDYSINDHAFKETYEECLTEDIEFDCHKFNYINEFWITEIDRTMFEDILKNIYFHDRFDTIKKNFLQTFNDDAIINVLHLRVEPDALGHWSRQNNMSVEEFKEYLEQKYIGLIERYIKKTDDNIIVSYSTDNPVLEYMKNNGYKYRCTDKTQSGRELNAIVDLLISTACNNIFIGNFNLKALNGSTFSYYISTLLDTDVKRIMIDLDHIRNEEQIT